MGGIAEIVRRACPLYPITPTDPSSAVDRSSSQMSDAQMQGAMTASVGDGRGRLIVKARSAFRPSLRFWRPSRVSGQASLERRPRLMPVLKRLERGVLWPSLADGTVTISTAQLSYLLSGIEWRMPQETWRPTAFG
jgi:hypothetical protein